MATKPEIQERIDEACFLFDCGVSTPAVAAHLRAKFGIGRTQAYETIHKANAALLAADDGAVAQESDDAAVGADLAPLLAASIKTALARGQTKEVKDLMGCLDKALTWQGLSGPHSRHRTEKP